MACFIIPAAEAAATTVLTKIIEKKEKTQIATDVKARFSSRLKWLNNMLWGGSALLAFEHIWHGEIVPWFPFLTNAANAADRAEMFHEMATAGVGMAFAVTGVWAVAAAAAGYIVKKTKESGKTAEEV